MKDKVEKHGTSTESSLSKMALSLESWPSMYNNRHRTKTAQEGSPCPPSSVSHRRSRPTLPRSQHGDRCFPCSGLQNSGKRAHGPHTTPWSAAYWGEKSPDRRGGRCVGPHGPCFLEQHFHGAELGPQVTGAPQPLSLMWGQSRPDHVVPQPHLPAQRWSGEPQSLPGVSRGLSPRLVCDQSR